jgi:hypothetical protein
MRTIALVVLSLFLDSTAYSYAKENQDGPSKSLCLIEKAAGVMFDKASKTSVPKAIRFEEAHSHFVVTIKPIVRSKEQRDWCLLALSHWMPILAERGTFDPDPQMFGRPYDLRANIGRCFASNEAALKFFDRKDDDKLIGYDYPDTDFVGLAGSWFKKFGDTFEAGESLDGGPVVYSGTCKSID